MSPCESHEDVATRIARIEENISLIRLSLQRIEERVYQGHGATSKLTGSFGTLLAVSGVAATIGAAIVALAKAL